MKNKGQNQKLFLKNFPLKLLGFVLAVLLWLVLNNTQDPVITSSVSVPITYEEGGLAEKNMVAISKPNAITIPVKLHRSRLRYLSADDFTVNDTVPYLENRGLTGYFEARKLPLVVKEVKGKKAFHFEGTQVYTSSFMLPATLQDNAPYTLEAWVLNDSISENECVADFTTSHDELEKIMLVNGTEPRCGVINHYGWYEDAGYKDMKELAGKWQHIYICFDGRMEQVYINGKLVSEKDIQLLVKSSQFITLGRNAEGDWPFTGYLHSLKLWDEYLPLKE